MDEKYVAYLLVAVTGFRLLLVLDCALLVCWLVYRIHHLPVKVGRLPLVLSFLLCKKWPQRFWSFKSWYIWYDIGRLPCSFCWSCDVAPVVCLCVFCFVWIDLTILGVDYEGFNMCVFIVLEGLGVSLLVSTEGKLWSFIDNENLGEYTWDCFSSQFCEIVTVSQFVMWVPVA